MLLHTYDDDDEDDMILLHVKMFIHPSSVFYLFFFSIFIRFHLMGECDVEQGDVMPIWGFKHETEIKANALTSPLCEILKILIAN